LLSCAPRTTKPGFAGIRPKPIWLRILSLASWPMAPRAKKAQAARGVQKRPATVLDAEEKPKDPAKRAKTIDNASERSMLSQFLERSLEKMSKLQLDRLRQHLEDDFTMSSACTGSGMAEVVHAELARMLDLPSQVAFSCEKVKTKREFYMSVVCPHLSEHGCMFEDMTALPGLVASCTVHGHVCKVPTRTNVHVCGFSCRDLSKLNNTWSAAERATVLQKQLGTSGKTFAALTNFANKAKPRCMILENVDELDDKGEPNPNLDFLYEVMSVIGYSVGQKTLVSTSFGLPQGRKRVYLVCVHNESFGLNCSRGQALVERVLQQVDNLHFETKSMYHFLLPPNHPHLLRELQAVQCKAESEAVPASAGWPAEHEALFKSKGISWKDMQPSQAMSSSPWYQKLTRRKREILNYHTFRARRFEDSAKGPLTTVDLSQSIGRASTGYRGICQTLTPKMSTWMVAHHGSDANNLDKAACEMLPQPGRPMLGVEAMMIQGFPLDWLVDDMEVCIPNAQLLDLAGNAFSSTVFAAVYLSLLAELPKPVVTQHDQSPRSELEAIFRSLC
jgi:site-specific DNA-cytosine methylase